MNFKISYLLMFEKINNWDLLEIIEFSTYILVIYL